MFFGDIRRQTGFRFWRFGLVHNNLFQLTKATAESWGSGLDTLRHDLVEMHKPKLRR